MPATTQKQEAMQAVRLLFDAAVKRGCDNPEALYRGRLVIEDYIQASKGKYPKTLHKDGVSFRVGDYVIYGDEGETFEAEIVDIDSVTIWLDADGLAFYPTIEHVMQQNPKGSFDK